MNVLASRPGRPAVENKKETRSFRIDPRLWKMVQAEAKSSGKLTSEIINLALARYVGNAVRSKVDLDDENLAHFLTRLDGVRQELKEMKGL